MFLLGSLTNKFDKNSVGLYRDDRFALFKNINSHCADEIRKTFHQLFKENELSLEIECNLKTVNYLDIANIMMKHFISTQNPTILQIFSKNYPYQSKLDYLIFPAILKFSMKHLNTIKIS